MDCNLEQLNSQLEKEPQNVELLLARAKYLYKIGDKPAAYNDLITLLQYDCNNVEARGYLGLISGIMNYEYREPLNV